VSRTEIAIADELVDELSEALFWSEFADRPRTNEDELVSYLIVARVAGLSIKIWADEHPPPHFHVSYQGQDASFSIIDCTRLPDVKGLERYENKIRHWWKGNRTELIETWNSSRPTDCPVGPLIEPMA
jgi:hypothetical protein